MNRRQATKQLLPPIRKRCHREVLSRLHRRVNEVFERPAIREFHYQEGLRVNPVIDVSDDVLVLYSAQVLGLGLEHPSIETEVKGLDRELVSVFVSYTLDCTEATWANVLKRLICASALSYVSATRHCRAQSLGSVQFDGGGGPTSLRADRPFSRRTRHR